ncbi:MAG: hypothetical protein HOU01_23030 [Streptomycetaceae bacterium]|nr:hypothetical protein [Streptomycetaceae bacterium]
MNLLRVSAAGNFRDSGDEPFPAIAASRRGVVVMTHPWDRRNALLEAADRAAPLACMVRLLQVEGASDFGAQAGS